MKRRYSASDPVPAQPPVKLFARLQRPYVLLTVKPLAEPALVRVIR
jgi:hypothetical protein